MYILNKLNPINLPQWYLVTHFVDGICLYDRDFIHNINYNIDVTPIEIVSVDGASAGTWGYLNKKMVEMGGMVNRTKESLVWHDGNGDGGSKLHPYLKRGVYTIGFKGSSEYKNLKI